LVNCAVKIAVTEYVLKTTLNSLGHVGFSSKTVVHCAAGGTVSGTVARDVQFCKLRSSAK